MHTNKDINIPFMAIMQGASRHPPAKNYKNLVEQCFTAHMPLEFSLTVLPALSLYP